MGGSTLLSIRLQINDVMWCNLEEHGYCTSVVFTNHTHTVSQTIYRQCKLTSESDPRSYEVT